jgi:hypothetical protein
MRGGFAAFVVLGAALTLMACASKPASPGVVAHPEPSTESAKPASTPVAPAEPPATSAVSTTPPTTPAAANVQTAVSPRPAAAQNEAKPEISFPYRRPLLPVLIVASLHEPEPPAPKSVAQKGAAPAAPAIAAPKVEPKPAATEPKAAPKPAAEVQPAAKAESQPKSAPPAKPATKVEPKSEAPEVPLKEPEPKNAPSSSSLSIVSAPAQETKPDIERNFSAVEGVRFEVPFEGTGWTYLGEKTSKEGIAYDSRRFEGSSLVFVLNPVKAGDYILRFQRQDALHGISYDELVGVSVAPTPTSTGKPTTVGSPIAPATSGQAVTAISAGAAPSSAAFSAGAAAPAGTAPAANPAPTATMPATVASAMAAPAPATMTTIMNPASIATPEAALAQARSELAAGHMQGTLDALDRLLTLAPQGTDEAYMLYARALEQNGPLKDIKRAYSYYAKVRDEYPESPFWDEASDRASYIERHYFDIR